MIELFRPIERRSGVGNPDGWLIDMFSGGASKTGVRVNPDTALSVAAVFACVQVRAQTLAALPLKLFRTKKNGDREPAIDHPLYSLLNSSPHPELTRFEFIEMMQGHVDGRGNCYAQKVRDGGGRIRRLVPLHPDRVVPRRSQNITPDGRRPLVYDVSNPGFGGIVRLDESEILHVRDFGSDGVVGYSKIRVACEPIGLAMAADEHAARMFSNGARPAGVLEHPQKLDDPGRENLRKSWESIHGGVGNSSRIAILEEGMKFADIGLTNEDAQLLESRKFSRSEIASIFRVPPHKIGDLERATFSNIEQQSIEFMQDCMLSICVRWEQRLDMSLLTEDERAEYGFKFNLSGLLRGDTQSRYNAYRIGLGRAGEPGWISVNDIRELEEMNRVEGGDNLFTGGQSNDKLVRSKNVNHALKPMLTDVLGRAFRKEAKAVRAIVKRSDKGELDRFYDDHRRYLIESLIPVAETLREMGSPRLIDPILASATIIEESRSDLGDSPTEGDSLEAKLLAWETTRALRTAIQLLNIEFS